MNNSIHRISLDIHDTGSQVSINAKKGDTARSIYITLQENSKPYRIADGCHAVFTGVKPDGNYLFNDCTIKDNVITYDFTEQTVPVVGQVCCEIILYDANNERITSPRFDIIVNDVVYNDEEIASSDEANALITATAEAKAITAEVEQKLANGEFVGEKGEKGEKGEQGVKGDKGDKGDKGEDADPQLFANAVKGYAEGEAVRVDDASPVEHIVNVKVEHTDPTSVKVTRCGKNLIDFSKVVFNGCVVKDNGVQAQFTNLYYMELGLPYLIDLVQNNDGKTLTFSVANPVVDARIVLVVMYEDGTYVANTSYTNAVSLTIDNLNRTVSKILVRPLSRPTKFTDTTTIINDLQLELSETATAFDGYKGVETYTPNADGTVEGITSLSPTMTLFTDTEGAVIHCEYNKDTNKALSSMQTADGTVVSQNADFAEVAEWADGNPNNEDRTGYFVCANVPVDGIVMKKATSTDDVKGVSILAPAFAGNYSKDKLDSNGNLLPKYIYVAIIGFVPVRDNGTCTVGGRCMPDDNGCAIPSSNNMGYQVVNRIDADRVLIIIEPNGDMVQRIKTRVNELQEDIDNLAPDQTYNPESPNAQSGIAVAEALATINVGGGGSAEGYEIIGDITLTEATSDIVFRDNINKYNDFLILFEGTVSEDGRLRFATGFNYGTGSFIIPSFLYVQSADATTQYTWYNKVDYIKSIENSDGTTNRIYLTSCCLWDTISTLRGWHTKQVKSLPTSFFVRAMGGMPYAVGSRFILLGRGAI